MPLATGHWPLSTVNHVLLSPPTLAPRRVPVRKGMTPIRSRWDGAVGGVAAGVVGCGAGADPGPQRLGMDAEISCTCTTGRPDSATSRTARSRSSAERPCAAEFVWPLSKAAADATFALLRQTCVAFQLLPM